MSFWEKVKLKGLNFLKGDSFSGVLLILSALLAITVANSPLTGLYDSFLHQNFLVKFGEFGINKPLILWINDGLMAIFFILVGMEVKHEIFDKNGALSSLKKSSLPIWAAIGGMVIPALTYTLFNFQDENLIKGWSIPMATDIAFALGVVALLGKRVPLALKVFLLALAIIDDLGAIVVIALFYSHDINLTALIVSVVAIVVLFVFNKLKVSKLPFYLIVGTILWVAMLKSGIHATLAGVIIGFSIPLKDKKGHSPLHEYEELLDPYVTYFILPVFAFSNAGIVLGQVGLSDLTNTLSLGVMLGLFLGKPIGVFLFSWLGVKFGLARLPENIQFKHIFAVSILCGIGFTMSMFLSGLSFSDINNLTVSRLAVLLASVLSAVLGYFALSYSLKPKTQKVHFVKTQAQ